MNKTALSDNYISRMLIPGVILFLSLFFYFPVGITLISGIFGGREGFSLPSAVTILTGTYYRRIIGFTFYQAALSTVFSIILALPGAYLLARFDFPGKKTVKAASAVPFILPPILVVLGFVIFFGNNGVLNRILISAFSLDAPPLKILYSTKAIILAHGFYNFPICLRIVSSTWERLPESRHHAAKTLGAHGIRLFLTVTLPGILPAIIASAALIFLFCFSSFAIILVLGGGPRFTTLEVEIYRAAKMALDMRTAGLLSAVSIIFTVFFLHTQLRLQSILSYREELIIRKKSIDKGKRLSRRTIFFIVIYIMVMGIIVIAPMVSVIVRSFQNPVSWGGGTIFSADRYIDLFRNPGSRFSQTIFTAVKNSLSMGFLTVLLSVPIGTLISYRISRGTAGKKSDKFFETFFMAPMTVSSVILGTGYLFIRRTFPVDFADPRILIALAHTVISYPFVIRAVTPVLKKIDRSLIHEAMILGATPIRAFLTVELPLIRPALISGAAFAFAISIGEMNATLIFSDAVFTTIPLAIYRMIGAYDFFGACVLGTLLMVLCGSAFLFIEQFDQNGEKL